MESAAPPEKNAPSSSSSPSPSPSLHNSRIPEDTLIYSIFPDTPLSTSSLQSLHLNILSTISPFISSYIWQHHPFRLSISTSTSNFPKCPCSAPPQFPHLCGKTRFGDNLDDEWFVVFLLFHISIAFPSVTARAFDADGEFLLIESAFSLPRWLSPATSPNRVFIRRGALHIVPKTRFPTNPSLSESLQYLSRSDGEESRAPDAVQAAIRRRIGGYPERARSNMHRVRVRVPVGVAHVMRHEPCLIALAVEGFYDRDVDSMKFAAKMERFGGEREEEMVRVLVTMSRAMYAQLVRQNFQAPRRYRMPERREGLEYAEAEMGMKIACGLEMLYQQRRREGLDGKGGSNWEAYRESLERSGYFEGLLLGSKDYRVRMENAMDYYRKSSVFSQTRYRLFGFVSIFVALWFY